MKRHDIPTPALVIDLAVVRQNIERLQRYAQQHGLRIRPHTKTHKSRYFSELQLAAGANGLTVAKVGEGEALSDLTDDLLIAFPMVDPARVDRVAALAREQTVRVSIDSTAAIEALSAAAQRASSTIGLLVDIDVGMGRTGVASNDEALHLAQLIDRHPGLRLDGIFCYPGQIWSKAEDQAEPLKQVANKLDEAMDRWARSGLSANIVSGGSTPTAYQSHLVKAYTEIRPGTYLFNDRNEWLGGFASLSDCAATIVATVVSNAIQDQVVVDCGTKTLTSDLCVPARDSGHGYVVEYPRAKVTKLSEEHGQIDVAEVAQRPKIGERIKIIPNHICPCVNLQDQVWLEEADGQVRPLVVEGRGKLS
jgi:D-serine deaminase-like pyridoxal phosphate-dependent protein